MPAARLVARAAGLLLVLMLVPAVVRAQALTPQPPGPFVIDIRGTTLGVPQGADFYPDIPGETIVPARGFGLQAGAQVYPWAIGSKRIGLGADFFLVRGTATTPVTTSTTTEATATPVTLPDVKVTMAIASPQLSMNFGSSGGWSYLTVGGGGASVKTSAGSLSLSTTALDINAGAGARWFLGDHLGVGFDLRVHWVGGNAMFGASAGFSLK